MPMTLKAARAIAGSIGYPSKMPGTSYGLPAEFCITGRKLAKIAGSTCASCYAFNRGNYIYPSVKKAQAKRLAGIEHELWVAAMVLSLAAAHDYGRERTRAARKRARRAGRNYRRLPRYHRWHDSGDLQSVEHFARICDVARRTPWLQHWLPTREAMFVIAYQRAGGHIPRNLIVRLSATMVDHSAPRALPHTSTVHDATTGAGHKCPAPTQGNQCGDCRACWSHTVANVTYHLH